MVADRITVSVFALDQVQLPRSDVARSWMARMAEASPILTPKAESQDLTVSPGPDGWELASTVNLGGARHHAGSQLVVDPVDARPGLFLVRIDGKAIGLASAVPWRAGEPHPATGAPMPERIAAYLAGTLIDTPDGPRPIETLKAGDAVTTLANGSRAVRWVGRRRVDPVELLAHPGLCPVEFAAGVIGNGRPLLVSQQQRILIDDWRAEVYFGEDRVLVAAQALVDDQATRIVLPTEGLDYIIVLCDRHEVLLAEGALSESFHPGEAGLAALSLPLLAEIAAVVPDEELRRRRSAFPLVRNAEARALRLRG